jgi:hypothetical protein
VFHDGRRRVLRQVAGRGRPFDVDLGPDERGRPTAVFAHCAQHCRVHAVTLPGGRDRALAVPSPAGASDRTPALWRERVVFQRRQRGQRVSRLISYNFRLGTTKVLRHGPVPRYHGHADAKADAIDLLGHVVAYVWSWSPAHIGVADEQQVRAQRLDGRGTVIGAGGYTSGECGFTAPVSPNATPSGLLWAAVWAGLDEVCADESIHGAAYAIAFGDPDFKRRRDRLFDHTLVRGLARDAADGTAYAIAGEDRHLTLVTAR